ncbi:MAG: hypothetical protein IK127_07155 [Clostridia bacterium]|nr:hypothetical protein [Clostridia bacterium]
MEGRVIRAAAREDLPALAALKAQYMRACYNGLARAETLNCICTENYAAEFAEWMERKDTSIDVLLTDDKPEAYIVFGRDAEGMGCIFEARTIRPDDTEGHHMLLDRVIDQLRAMGCSAVRAWLLRNNYRKRFFYEGYGFRVDGERRLDRHAEECFEMVQYVYSL